MNVIASLIAALLGVLVYLLPSQTKAIDGLMLSTGSGMNDMLIQYKDISDASHQSIGAFWETDFEFQADWLADSKLEIEAYISEVELDQKRRIVAVRPVLNFSSEKNNLDSWYWQFGVGLSYFDGKQLGPVTLSTKAQFATIFGLGIPLDNGKHRLTLRYNHYSNGYLKKPNQGIDTFSLDWHYRF